jgi:NADPH:quinone reductase-like Zn-dependent oxidoreductase
LSTDLGPWGQNVLLALGARLSRGRRVLFPIPKGFGREAVEDLRELIASGRFTPVVDRSYPLAEVVDAYRYVETGQKVGNVVIVVGDHAA